MFSRLAPLWALLVLAIAVRCRCEGSPSCLDEDGNPVDWYMVYKFPSMRDQPQPFKSGLSYAYITSKQPGQQDDGVAIEEIPNEDANEPATESPSVFMRLRTLLDRYIGSPSSASQTPKRGHSSDGARKPYRESVEAEASSSNWVVSKRLITDPKSLVLRTLQMAYATGRPEEDLNWILYNDQPPQGDNLRGPSSKKAHAKGIVLMDTKKRDGVWLTHSVPQFPPPLGQRLRFDENVDKFGQTFMCINFDIKLAGLQIARHLGNMNALIYDTKIDDNLFKIVPGLSELTARWALDGSRRRKGQADKGQAKLVQQITSRAGQQMSIYSKSAELEADLYAGWLEHELSSSLYVETWQNGQGHPLNSSCSDPDYSVNNVRELQLYDPVVKRTVFSWQHQKDHSKWAISETEARALVCIADINRMESQFERGGGAVCMKCANCWQAFSKTILDVEPCHNRRKTMHRHVELAGR